MSVGFLGFVGLASLFGGLWLGALALKSMFFPDTPPFLLGFIIFVIGCAIPPHPLFWWALFSVLLLNGK